MREIRVSDEVYDKLKRVADACSFESVELYLANVPEDELLWDQGVVPDSFWTPEILAEIDKGLKDIEEGRVFTLEEVERHFQKKSKAWRDRAS